MTNVIGNVRVSLAIVVCVEQLFKWGSENFKMSTLTHDIYKGYFLKTLTNFVKFKQQKL